jgi:hypothetical protein
VIVEKSAWKACLDEMAMEGRGFRDFPCWSAVLTQACCEGEELEEVCRPRPSRGGVALTQLGLAALGLAGFSRIALYFTVHS